MTRTIVILPVSKTPLAAMAAEAWQDMYRGFRDVDFWVRLAYFDLVLRYRRTSFGPWWVVVTTALSVGSLGLIFSLVMHQNPAKYLPYLASGIILWQFISLCITISCDTLEKYAETINNTRTDYSRFILRLIGYHVLILAHNLTIFVVVAVIFKVDFLVMLPLFALGMILVMINLYWIGMLVALLSARFHDVTQVIQAAMSLLFLITPVFWHKQVLGKFAYLAVFNPLVHLLDVVRDPLLGQVPSALTYEALIGMGAAGLILVFLLLTFKRRLIPFWV